MNNYEEYLSKLGFDELNDIHLNIDREKYKDRFELVKMEISKRKKGKSDKGFIMRDEIEVTSNKDISLIAVLLCMILLPCGVYTIYGNGIVGIVPGIFFILLSIFFGAVGLKDLFELPVGRFENQGNED